MIFEETRLKGAYIILPERQDDERGFFARSWCERELNVHAIPAKCVQCNISFNRRKGTLRGMHYQASPHEEAKWVRCTMGAIYDVAVDLRRESPTFGEWISVGLTAENRKMIYIPEGLAHGFLTLEENTEVFYQMSEFYTPECSRGVRWNDPLFNIRWPFDPEVVSNRDRGYPDFLPETHG
jgi:dTDP-4-dehydrorhamnose 3,5-epimerase